MVDVCLTFRCSSRRASKGREISVALDKQHGRTTGDPLLEPASLASRATLRGHLRHNRS